mgnify:CR=1 FL=1
MFTLKSLYYYLVLTVIIILGCQDRNTRNLDCAKFENENYIKNELASTEIEELFTYKENFLIRFNDTSIQNLPYESYHLFYYSSFSHGKTIKLEKRNDGFIKLSVTCYDKYKSESNFECKKYHMGIIEEEWKVFENMIYDYNFWTEKDIIKTKEVLDGYGFILEGIRPEAEKCNKRTHHILFRGSPEYDKIGTLCYYLMDYEEKLARKYGHRKKD